MTRPAVLLVMSVVGALAAVLLPGAVAGAARTDPGDQVVQVAPWPRSAVSAGDTVTVTFPEPVRSVVATWGPLNGTATPIPVTAAPARTSAAVVLPAPLAQARGFRLSVTATTDAGASVARVVDYYGLVNSTPRRVGPTTRVMNGTSAVYGTKGRLFRFTIETHRPLSSQMQVFAQEALRVLTDPARGWTARGAYRLQRVDNPRRADIRLLLARPPLVDALCLKAGLHTGGMVSCWNHEFASLNSDRWFTGALSRGFSSLRDYRTYLISHEFGHGLHLHHAYCPRRGALASVMQQQTGGQDGCRSNGWPYPR